MTLGQIHYSVEAAQARVQELLAERRKVLGVSEDDGYSKIQNPLQWQAVYDIWREDMNAVRSLEQMLDEILTTGTDDRQLYEATTEALSNARIKALDTAYRLLEV